MPERKVLGKFVRNEPRTVRFGGPDSDRTTLCAADMLRDILANVLGSEEVGWTEAEYARQLRMPQTTLNAIVGGKRDANLETLERLAALGRIDVCDVFLQHAVYHETRFAADLAAGENPWADLRVRGNTTPKQRERLGLALEDAATVDGVEDLIEFVERMAAAFKARAGNGKKRKQ